MLVINIQLLQSKIPRFNQIKNYMVDKHEDVLEISIEKNIF